jgi:hypothetical protein
MAPAATAEQVPVPALWMNPRVGMKFRRSLPGSPSNRPTEALRTPAGSSQPKTDHLVEVSEYWVGTAQGQTLRD